MPNHKTLVEMRIPHDTSLKVLDVTITNGLSASDHVRGGATNYSQTLYALRVLRTHGMSDLALLIIFWLVVLAKLLCVQCLVKPMRPTSSESTPSVFVAATVCLICLRSKSCARLLTNCCSPTF